MAHSTTTPPPAPKPFEVWTDGGGAQRYLHGTKADLRPFPGNPTRSYRTRAPLRVVGELTDWTGHTREQIQATKAGILQLAAQGLGAIE